MDIILARFYESDDFTQRQKKDKDTQINYGGNSNSMSFQQKKKREHVVVYDAFSVL